MNNNVKEQLAALNQLDRKQGELLRPRTTGARSWIFVRSGSAMI